MSMPWSRMHFANSRILSASLFPPLLSAAALVDAGADEMEATLFVSSGEAHAASSSAVPIPAAIIRCFRIGLLLSSVAVRSTERGIPAR